MVFLPVVSGQDSYGGNVAPYPVSMGSESSRAHSLIEAS